MTHDWVCYALDADAFERVWPPFSAMIATGDIHSYTQDLDMVTARALWSTPPARNYVAEQAG